jgi:hypothetical protein
MLKKPRNTFVCTTVPDADGIYYNIAVSVVKRNSIHALKNWSEKGTHSPESAGIMAESVHFCLRLGKNHVT